MDVTESIKRALQELVMPELGVLREDQAVIRATQVEMSKRLDDVHTQLAEQSRRIDATNQRLDGLRAKLSEKFDAGSQRLDGTNQRLDNLRAELSHEIDETNKRLDRLYEVIVRRDEHYGLQERVGRLEQGLSELRSRLAA